MPIALIVGASRGIGREFAVQYLDAGWTVHCTVRDPSQARDLAERGATVHVLDVRDDDERARLHASLQNASIDLILHNAGVRGPRDATLGNLDHDVWHDVFAVNAIAPIKLAERFVEQVAISDRKIMGFISSWRGSIGENTDGGLYMLRSSKAALNASIRSLAIDLAPRAITAVALHPGWVRTDMGGQDAPLAVEAGVAGLRTVIEHLTLADSGSFIANDGRHISW